MHDANNVQDPDNADPNDGTHNNNDGDVLDGFVYDTNGDGAGDDDDDDYDTNGNYDDYRGDDAFVFPYTLERLRIPGYWRNEEQSENESAEEEKKEDRVKLAPRTKVEKAHKPIKLFDEACEDEESSEGESSEEGKVWLQQRLS